MARSLVHFDWDSATSGRGTGDAAKSTGLRVGGEGEVEGVEERGGETARGCKGRIIKVKYSVCLLYGEKEDFTTVGLMSLPPIF